jgi:hypothetical protein
MAFKARRIMATAPLDAGEHGLWSSKPKLNDILDEAIAIEANNIEIFAEIVNEETGERFNRLQIEVMLRNRRLAI